MGLGIWFLSLVMVAQSFAAIFGEDDRREWFEAKDAAVQSLGRATAVMIQKKDAVLEKTADGFRLASSTKTHEQYDHLCPGETYGEQAAPGSCTTFLVDDDKLLTAGHCVPDGCDKNYYVFDFLKDTKESLRTTFSESQVFECKEILAIDKDKDWALLRLDRPTTGRTPYKISQAEEPKVGTPLVVLGFPRGLPLKIAGGAQVEESMNSDEAVYLESFFDAFGGNSGSPVINSDTKVLEGIYTVGFGEFDDDVDPATGKACQRLARRETGEGASGWVSRASNFRAIVESYLRKTPTTSTW